MIFKAPFLRNYQDGASRLIRENLTGSHTPYLGRTRTVLGFAILARCGTRPSDEPWELQHVK